MNLLSLLLAVVATAGGDGQAALADLAQFPPDQQWRYKYVTAEPIEPESRAALDVALRLVIPSTSLQPNLDYCSPARIGETLSRIDLAGLGWNLDDWQAMVAKYPYSPTGSTNPLIVRGDWLLLQLTDCENSRFYYDFTLGKRPKDRDEFFSILAVNTDKPLRIGLAEGDSGVSVSGKRTIINFATTKRGYAFITEDTATLSPDRDPLEQAQGGAPHDGEEAIVAIRKFDPATRAEGVLFVYALFNGKGVTVDKAPANLVVDHNQTLGTPEIVNVASCIGCHRTGYNWPTTNEFRGYLESGVQVFASYDDKEFLESFHLGDTDKQIRRANEDYASVVESRCGCKPAEASAYYQAAVSRYDDELTLERAAFESKMAPEEFKQALAFASATGYKLGARVSGLAHGKTISRDAWEPAYVSVRQLAELWRNQ